MQPWCYALRVFQLSPISCICTRCCSHVAAVGLSDQHLTPAAALDGVMLQVRSRAISAESGASDALAESTALEQQLHATKEEVGNG
jgi:hypothetical protein